MLSAIFGQRLLLLLGDGIIDLSAVSTFLDTYFVSALLRFSLKQISCYWQEQEDGLFYGIAQFSDYLVYTSVGIIT